MIIIIICPKLLQPGKKVKRPNKKRTEHRVKTVKTVGKWQDKMARQNCKTKSGQTDDKVNRGMRPKAT